MATVSAEKGSVASYVTTVPLGTMVTQHVYHVAATQQEQMRSSATQH